MRRLVEDEVRNRVGDIEAEKRPRPLRGAASLGRRPQARDARRADLARADRPREGDEAPPRRPAHVDQPRAARRGARLQHDLGRPGHRPPRADGRHGPAEDHERVHPGDEPRGARLPGPRRHVPQRHAAPRPLALRALRRLPRELLPRGRGDERHAVQRPGARPRPRGEPALDDPARRRRRWSPRPASCSSTSTRPAAEHASRVDGGAGPPAPELPRRRRRDPHRRPRARPRPELPRRVGARHRQGPRGRRESAPTARTTARATRALPLLFTASDDPPRRPRRAHASRCRPRCATSSRASTCGSASSSSTRGPDERPEEERPRRGPPRGPAPAEPARHHLRARRDGRSRRPRGGHRRPRALGLRREGYVALDDPRLRRSLVPRLKALDPDLDLAREGYFRMAPEGDARDPYPNVGVRALEFPRWFVCQKCRRLARAAEQFENKGGRYRHAAARRTSGRRRCPCASWPPASAGTCRTSPGSPSPTWTARAARATGPSSTSKRRRSATSRASSSGAATAAPRRR